MRGPSIDFSAFRFGPVIHLPADYEVYDFSHGYDATRARRSAYGIGKYNEKRPQMYVSDLFQPASSDADARDIHVGIDIAAPVGTLVHAFFAGRVFMTGINGAKGDYGGTVITEHVLAGFTLFALHGHLSHDSVIRRQPGEVIALGDPIGEVGPETENGGWNPHLHFQLSWKKPQTCDMPGVVSERDRAEALSLYPDPRLVLGSLY